MSSVPTSSHHRAEGFVADVEIVGGEAAALAGKDAIIGILGWVFRHGDTKRRSLLPFQVLATQKFAAVIPIRLNIDTCPVSMPD